MWPPELLLMSPLPPDHGAIYPLAYFSVFLYGTTITGEEELSKKCSILKREEDINVIYKKI